MLTGLRNYLQKINIKVRKYLDDNLFHVKDSNWKLTCSLWLGFFVGMLPFGGYHLVLAVFLAHFLKLNTLVAGAFTMVSSAPLEPFLIFGSCWCGSLVLGHSLPKFNSEFDFSMLAGMLVDYIVGAFIFAAVVSSLLALICAIVLQIARPKGRSLAEGEAND